jgi:predicted metalloprotease
VLDDARNGSAFCRNRTAYRYRHAKLVLFRDATDSSCGLAQAATGPFYCPADEKVYVDLGFFDELKNRFGAPGEFAQAYVLAHEIGHHVQKILGISDKVHALQERNPTEARPLSVRLELQADLLCRYLGTDGARNLIEQKDVEAGIRAAGAVGGRPDTEDDPRTRKSGILHPRFFCAARGVDRAWVCGRRPRPIAILLQEMIPVSPGPPSARRGDGW